MSYTPYYENGWKNNEDGGTPITAAALNNIEEGIIELNSNYTDLDSRAYKSQFAISKSGAQQTLTNSEAIIKCLTKLYSRGSGMELQSTYGGIRCKTAGTYKVEGHLRVSGATDGDEIAFRICIARNNEYIDAYEYRAFCVKGRTVLCVSPAKVISVSAGDVLYMRARNVIAGRGTVDTCQIIAERV